MIIDASKDYTGELMKRLNSRGCGKSNMTSTIIEAWAESYATKKPVEVNFGYKLINIDDLEG